MNANLVKSLLIVVWTVIAAGAGAVGKAAYRDAQVKDLTNKLATMTTDRDNQQKRAVEDEKELAHPPLDPLSAKYKADGESCQAALRTVQDALIEAKNAQNEAAARAMQMTLGDENAVSKKMQELAVTLSYPNPLAEDVLLNNQLAQRYQQDLAAYQDDQKRLMCLQ